MLALALEREWGVATEPVLETFSSLAIVLDGSLGVSEGLPGRSGSPPNVDGHQLL